MSLPLVQSLIPTALRDTLRRKAIEIIRGGYFGLNGLDKKLEHYVNYDGGFYVELGANDGYTQSNSYYFELKRGWKGVLIEPSPHNFLHCQRLRGANNAVHCNACVGFDYRDRFVEIAYANLMSVSRGLDLDLDDAQQHLNAAHTHLQASEQTTFRFGALARPLSHILDDSQAPAVIDFLSLDVEGAELEVLKGVDFDKYRFKFMLIECRQINRVAEFLNHKGYRLLDQLSPHDYLFTSDPAARPDVTPCPAPCRSPT